MLVAGDRIVVSGEQQPLSALSPQDSEALELVLTAACETYSRDVGNCHLRRAIDRLDELLRHEYEYQDGLVRKHPVRGADL